MYRIVGTGNKFGNFSQKNGMFLDLTDYKFGYSVRVVGRGI